MKAFLSVVVVAAILGFLVWQRWEGNGAVSGSAAGGPDVVADRESPLSALSTPEPAPRDEAPSDGESPPASEPSSAADATPKPAELSRSLGRAEFAREVAGADPLGALRLASSWLVAADDSPERDVYLAEVLEVSDRLLLSRQASPAASFDYVVASGDTIDRLTKRVKRERGARRHVGIRAPRERHRGSASSLVGPKAQDRHGDAGDPRFEVAAPPRLHARWGDRAGVPRRARKVRQDARRDALDSIGSRLPTPVWFNAGESIPYGDPRNILGTRWLGFETSPRWWASASTARTTNRRSASTCRTAASGCATRTSRSFTTSFRSELRSRSCADGPGERSRRGRQPGEVVLHAAGRQAQERARKPDLGHGDATDVLACGGVKRPRLGRPNVTVTVARTAAPHGARYRHRVRRADRPR